MQKPRFIYSLGNPYRWHPGPPWNVPGSERPLVDEYSPGERGRVGSERPLVDEYSPGAVGRAGVEGSLC